LSHFIGRLAGAGPLAWAVLALGLLAAALMIATEFSTIQSVRIGESTCGAAEEQLRDVCQTGGGEQHNWSLLVLGVLTVLLAFGAAVGRSKPAAYALGFVGVVVLFVALVLDRPTLDDKHGLEVFFGEQGTSPKTGGGYTLEILAGVLALLACGAALLRERLRPQERVGSRARVRERGAASAEDEAAPDPAA
jgi:peptidoglycan/LPS O-acetylase OafA/YrhL